MGPVHPSGGTVRETALSTVSDMTADKTVVIPETAMAVGSATVRIHGLPVTVTAGGARSVTDDVRAALVEAVTLDVLTARTRRLSGRVNCSTCEGDLFFPSRRSEKPVPALAGDHAVTVLVEADWARCRDCGLEHLDPVIGLPRVMKALHAAIDATI